jgi:hypothetical protein
MKYETVKFYSIQMPNKNYLEEWPKGLIHWGTLQVAAVNVRP